MDNDYIQLINLLSHKNIEVSTAQTVPLLLSIDKKSIQECDYKSIEEYLSAILVYNQGIKGDTRDKLVSTLEYLRDEINKKIDLALE